MANFLVIGGSGVMGKAAIQAIRKVHGKEAFVVASWFGKEDLDYKILGADCTVFGDITQDSCIETIKSIKGEDFDYLFYATALGEVGFPIKDSTPEQIAHSNRLSFDPLPCIEEKLKVRTIVTYSTFYLLKHQICSYGAMGYSKEKIEKWTVEANAKSRRSCIRAGLFESHSSRAIKLLLRKNARSLSKETNPLLHSYFDGHPASQGIKNFEDGIRKEEIDNYGDSLTTIESLEDAHLKLFNEPEGVFINVCGKKIWLSDQPLLLKNKI